jgi:hypothetical protein
MPDQFQYVKLPDGSYGKFAANATDAQIRAQVAKNFPNAYKTTQPATTKPTAEETFKLMSEKPPENARFPRLGRTGYEAADSFIRSLPGMGSIVGAAGGTAAGGGAASPLTAIGGAGLGAMAGDRAQQMLTRLIYKDLPDETWGEAGRSMFTQGALGAFSEGGAQTAKGVLDTVIENLGTSAKSIKDARVGSGVRQTPGEVSSGTMLKKAESVLEHWPGGAGPLEEFREGQQADVYREVERQLSRISKENLTSEEAGKEVQRVIADARGKLDTRLGAKTQRVRNAQTTNVQSVLNTRLTGLSPTGVTAEQAGRGVQKSIEDLQLESQKQVGAKFDEVRRLLGKPPGTHMTPEEFDRGVSELSKSKVLGPTGQPIPSPAGAVARGRLGDARRFFQTEQERFNVDIFGKILATQKPELIGGMYEKAGLDELRTLDKSLPTPVKRNIARNVFDNMINRAKDPQTGAIRTKSLATSLKNLGEERGRIIFGNQYERILESSKVIDRINQAADRATESIQRTGSKKFDADLIQKISGENNPALISGFFKNASPDDLRTLKTMLPKQVQQNISRNTLESFIAPARDSTGEIDPGTLGKSLAKNLHDMGETRGRVIFGDQYDNIVEASKLLERIGKTDSGVSGKIHMASFLGGLAGSIGLGATGHPLAASASLVSPALAPRIMSLALTHPQYSRMALQGLRALAVTTARGIPYAADQILQTSPAQYAPLPQLEAPQP